MLVPRATLIATGAEDQEPYDGSVQYVFYDKDTVILDSGNLANKITPEAETEYEPTFESLDEEWLIEDDE